MESCPVEILLHISRLACLDDGTTGRSLSSVSRSVRAASSPSRFQSLAFRGRDQMARFVASALHLRSTAVDVDVRFLFISMSAELEQAADERSIAVSREEVKQPPEPAQNIAINFFTHFGQTLECLTIDQASDITLISLQQIPLILPKLHTLTMPVYAYQIRAGSKLVLPSLHTAHVTRWRVEHDAGRLWDRLAMLAPGNTLRRLRISGGIMLHRLMPLLRSQLNLPFADTQQTTQERVQRLSHLRESCVHLLMSHSDATKDEDSEYSSIRQLKRVTLDVAEAKVPCGRFQVLIDPEYTAEDAIADWLEEIAGGEGCWSGSRAKDR